MKTLFARCKACTPPTRHPGCHSTCTHYINDKQESDARLAERHSRNQAYREIMEVSIRATTRAKR